MANIGNGEKVYNAQLDAFDLYHLVHEHPFTSSSQKNASPGGPGLPALGHATAGAVGSAISNVVTYPLALIVTRLQIQRSPSHHGKGKKDYASVLDAARTIYTNEGIKAFYAGVTSDSVKTVADAFLFFLAYHFLRQQRLKRAKAGHLAAMDELSIGFIAGALAKFVTTPLANVVARKQTDAMITSSTQDGDRASQGMRDVARTILRERGIQGLWAGYSASLVLTLNPSLTFFFFEMLKRVRRRITDRAQGPQATFLMAALSKALASSITYPFSLAKSRLQVGARSQQTGAAASGTKGGNSSASRTNAGSNVLGMLAQIVREEGVGALYEGLPGEVLKGFFSHGTTMLVKDAVHSAVIQYYYILLRLLRKYPAQELADRAKTDVISTKAQATKVVHDSRTQAHQLAAATTAVPKIGRKATDSTQTSTTHGLRHRPSDKGMTGSIKSAPFAGRSHLDARPDQARPAARFSN